MKRIGLYALSFLMSLSAFIISVPLLNAADSRLSPPSPVHSQLALPPLEDLNILLIVVDTLGTGHLGAYDPALHHSPRITRLAKNGVLFKKTYAVSPWTKPSVASLFTGQYPARHGVTRLGSTLPAGTPTLAEILRRKGFRTGGIVSHTLLTARYGYDRGFDDYRIVKYKGNVHKVVSSELVSNDGIKWIESVPKDKRFFLFLHYFDPHFNYNHHPKFDQTSSYQGQLKGGMGFRELRRLLPTFTKDDFSYLVGLYREEIAFTDFHIGRVIDSLAQMGRASDTLVVFVADHGEEFGEHNELGHTRTLFDELVHIPFIFYLPGSLKPQERTDLASQIDLLPTILSLASESEELPNLDGISLLDSLEGRPLPARNLISEVDFDAGSIKVSKIGVMDERWKLVKDRATSQIELYDRASDPKEKKPLGTADSPQFQVFEKKLGEFEAYHASKKAPPSPELTHDAKELKELKSLGYL